MASEPRLLQIRTYVVSLRGRSGQNSALCRVTKCLPTDYCHSPGVMCMNGVDQGHAFLMPDPVKILFVGGDLERKGGLVLLEAFRALRRLGARTSPGD